MEKSKCWLLSTMFFSLMDFWVHNVDKWNISSRFYKSILLELLLKIILILFSHFISCIDFCFLFCSVLFFSFLSLTLPFFITTKLVGTFALILSRWWQKISGRHHISNVWWRWLMTLAANSCDSARPRYPPFTDDQDYWFQSGPISRALIYYCVTLGL